MNIKTFKLLEEYMLSCTGDSAHDKEHIYRVLYTALEIAEDEPQADGDILIAACLLHDICRREQNENPKICHARAGAEKAERFLLENGFSADFAKRTAECISTHRFRGDNPPESAEAKILFDADKLDAAGTLGIARTLLYNGKMGEPLYSLDENGIVSDGSADITPSFLQEYKYKLEKVYSRLITKRGREIGEERRKSAQAFYEAMLDETRRSYIKGKEILNKYIQED